ncbi:general secretion pathway protein GspI [Pseudomonas fluorescens]|uniref:Prepilin-type N-terminal cleavage/methylation domain-containing protein n=1 Tax=Pseudomonas lactucae TaxID=2813360 RepID=A0A9X1C7A3_9PSED|nr:prepilin-type N-terminal cleavage/methylation domain-containing protein [Pseudomonas lactucae]OPA87892.1 general secretion pathway protein GspI [Pseudomonas fluorescens]MBN2978951.1 prepilin-type N-terminal cleavage/methylation domain-containing protein [Pseudomonas lactucae]MBN2990000.1 prepilin-type N-terminal cleavage/methylation domain-containing protein [Pseudomonas lactucae]OPB07956.1 general secretion pathway protein GspI [Pseudomonas fluorescens]OPB18731.1 general secretion pathway 
MKHQRGFTLLEMLAALTLMAICSTVLLVAFGQSARSLSQVAHSDRLTHAALSVMDQEGAGPLANGTRQGELDGIAWQLRIAQQPARVGQAPLFRLDLSISEGPRQAQFSTLKLRAAGAGL